MNCVSLLVPMALAVLTQEAPPRQSPAPGSPLARMAVVGASVSAGSGNSLELELPRSVGLGTFLAAALAPTEPSRDQAPDAAPKDLGNVLFFRDPNREGRAQIRAALDSGPRAVVAVDFLFWFAYGEPRDGDPRRSAGLEQGLRMLEELECPIVLGDLPNIEHALEGKGPFGGPLVHRGLFPSEAERADMNGRIRAWATKRGRVAVVPLSDLVKLMERKGTVTVRGGSWTIQSIDQALQRDRLHPTALGTGWLVLKVADALVELGLAKPEQFIWDGARVKERLIKATEEQRTAKSKLDAERAARKRERAERRRRRESSDGSGR